MAVNYLYPSAFSTAAGFVFLQWWTVSSLEGMKAYGLIGREAGGDSLEVAGRALELLLSSHVIVVQFVNFVINVYFLVVLLLKAGPGFDGCLLLPNMSAPITCSYCARRGAAYDPSLTPPWMNQGMDGASSSSSVTSVAFGGIQMKMRQLASVSEKFYHGSLHDSAWNQWHSHTMVPTFPPSSSLRLNRNAAKDEHKCSWFTNQEYHIPC
ncbi:hypothetical protein ZIOFF_040107 [Zingiber officinale]|uniref:Uncharacterized protein n=1 Tax=Zingiber officinale TaxID=94328 RepID=A0A8J5G847_ZINOF|nr:hypothetical protein ZIOFF_040107 [Zingiber officinale]